jgi:hypothetical protein
MVQESTPQGDSVEVTNVDTAAQALLARYEGHDKPVSDANPPQEDEESEIVEETVEDSEEVNETESEESEEVSESEDTDAIEESEEARFETLTELAEATGMELDEFLKSVKTTTKVDGEQNEVNLSDLIKGYQLEKTYTRKNEAFIQQQKEWNEQREQAQTKLDAELERVGYAFKYAQDQLTHEFNAINWSELEQSNPQEFLIQRQKFGERQAQINQGINQATQYAQSIKQEQAAELAAKQQQDLKAQDELLLKAIPEWSDNTVRAEQSKQVGEFLTKVGYSPEEVANITDHRVILMARNAMNGDKMKTDVNLAKKKVKKVPKLVKPSARQNVNQSKVTQQQKLVKRAQKTGRVDDIAAALVARRS